MLYAIVSDIHGNYTAWAAVLEDIRSIGVERIVCLGDVVGYGPEPGRCVQSIRDVAYACILGNHDAVVTKKLDSRAFNEHARKLIEWTELQLNPEEIEYLSTLNYEFSEENFRCVHGDCDAPHEFNYIVDCDDARLTWNKITEHIVFCGHSHLPAVFVTTRDGSEMCSLPAQDFSLEEQNRYIVNVGSVGSPRDDDLRASYVLFDSETKSIFFRRICYDFNEFRERVRFVGLNESDVPLLCYVLEEEPAEDVALEHEITKSEIVVSNESSDLAKTVCLHQIDLSDILKAESPLPKQDTSKGKLSFKKPIIIKKQSGAANQQTSSAATPAKNNMTVLSHKPGVRKSKINANLVATRDANGSRSRAPQAQESKYLRKVNAAEQAPAKKLIFSVVIGIILLMVVGMVYSSTHGNRKGKIARYHHSTPEIYHADAFAEKQNLLPEIWMSSGNLESLYPYQYTTSDRVKVSFDNIDGMYGSELIFHNVENAYSQLCFETPYVKIDPKGKYLILAKVYYDESNYAGNIYMQLVNANESELAKALPSEKMVEFHKKEISKTLYKNQDIPKCFKYRPSKAGWWLAKRTVEGRELKEYIRIIIRGEFKGRVSIGGISIQRVD